MSSSTMSSSGGFDSVTALADRRFPDIPLPPGAREDLQRTYVYESCAILIGRMFYLFKATVNEVVHFYIEQASMNHWVLNTWMQFDVA